MKIHLRELRLLRLSLPPPSPPPPRDALRYCPLPSDGCRRRPGLGDGGGET